MSEGFDEDFDLVVVGSGGGALVGALVGAANGLSVCLVEKTKWFGGTTALSGGGVFIPNNPVILRAGVPDTAELGREYLRKAIDGSSPEALQDAYLQAGPELISWLEDNDHLHFRWNEVSGFPDYRPDVPGGFSEGRTIGPVPIEDVSPFGDLLAQIRPALERGQGGLPRVDDPTRLTSGRALVGSLLLACDRLGVDLRLETPLTDLVVEDGVVIGVEVSQNGLRKSIGARRGVLLAAGGFERNEAFRRQHQPVGAGYTLGIDGNTGEVIQAGISAGAAVALMDEAWWTPSFVYPDGSTAFVLVERALPGGVIVDGTGGRYANESLPYNQFGHKMLEFDSAEPAHVPSYLITDQHFLDRYPFFGLRPGEDVPQEWLDAGVVRRADSIAELAKLLDLPVGALEATIDECNEAARTGRDEKFGRGDSFADQRLVQVFVNAGNLPAPEGENACLAPIAKPPFYAAAIHPGDLGTKGGLVCDEHARVERPDGGVIEGLYATGNTMASVMGNDYPGPGATIGPSIVFGYLAALHAAGRDAR